MGRKPANKLRIDETREAAWAEIRKAGVAFTVKMVAHATRLSVSSTRDYITGLTAAGYLEKALTSCHHGSTVEYRYTLIKDCGMEAPRVRKDGTIVNQGMGREQLWRALGILAQKGTRFDFRDLRLYASTEKVTVSESDTKHYIRYLLSAGYLIMVETDKPGVAARYRMLQSKWTGPRPPQIQRVRQLYDPNLKKVVWNEEGEV